MTHQTRVPSDLTRVTLDQPWEIEYWTKSLGATEQELRDALHAVGPSAEQVQSYLSRKDPLPEVP